MCIIDKTHTEYKTFINVRDFLKRKDKTHNESIGSKRLEKGNNNPLKN
jgi:hypothetical protein